MDRRRFLRSALALGAVAPVLPFLPALPKAAPEPVRKIAYAFPAWMGFSSGLWLDATDWNVKTLGPMKVTRWK